MKLLLNFVFICGSLNLVYCAPLEDFITSLPGLSKLPSYKQYSGYLTASATKHFHYWFAESQRDPMNDPVVLWLNGGPGCSSLDGYLSENGPLHVHDNGDTLYENPYSWNRIANVLYLESPAGVGYSYDEKNNNFQTNDDEVSMHNYNALVDFFKKFSEFSKNSFFVIGESYGGIYVPTLGVRIIEESANINLKGVSIGNGITSFKENDRSLIFFAYYHGLFGIRLKDKLSQACCNGGWTRETCDFTNKAASCRSGVAEAMHLVYYSGLNEYALYLDCYHGTRSSSKRYRTDMTMLFRDLNPKWRSSILNRKVSGSRKLGLDPPCINSSASTAWLNKNDVRSALHIKTHLPKWEVCNENVNLMYETVYDNMTAQYERLLKDSNLRILVYNGDTDMACNFLGDEWFVDDLKRPIKHARAPWFVGDQVAGFVKTFDRITFTTIRGAGHMVPQWAPEYSFAMYEKFLKNEPFNI